MTVVSDADGTSGDLYADRVEALSRALARLRFDPYVDIDWDAPENALDENDPCWQLDPDTDPLAATDWYAEVFDFVPIMMFFGRTPRRDAVEIFERAVRRQAAQ